MTDVNDLEKVLHRAFAIALEGRQGPVLVDIPKDVQIAAVEEKHGNYSQLRNKVKLPPANVGGALALMSKAKKPNPIRRWWCRYGASN